MGITRRSLVAAGALVCARPALAQDAYPSRPVRVIVPFPPGQATDVFARMVADGLSQRWSGRVVVENRAGAAGSIGTDAIAKSTPDGYNLGMGAFGTLGAAPGLIPNLPYDPLRDFTPIVHIFRSPNVIIAHPSFPASTMVDLVKRAKEEAQGIDYASGGPGSTQHLAGEYLRYQLQLRLNHIPYRGSGPALADVLGGRVPLMIDSIASSLPHIREGRVKALAVTMSDRWPQLPDVPTVSETVLPGFDVQGWGGLVGPKGIPDAVVRRINTEAAQILRDPAIAARMVELGGTPYPGSPEDFGRFIAAEVAKWQTIIRNAGIKLEG